MSKKRAQSRQGKKKVRPDEVFETKGFTMIRTGRVVEMVGRSNGDGEILPPFPSVDREALKVSLNQKIESLVQLAKQFDSINFICRIFCTNNMVDPESYSEPSHDGVAARAEYAQSLVSAVTQAGTSVPDEQDCVKFEDLISEVLNDWRTYILTKPVDPGAPIELEATKFLGMIRHVFVRGSAFPSHATELIQSIFRPHDGFLTSHGLPSTDEFIQFCDDVTKHIETSLQRQLDVMAAVNAAHLKFVELSNQRTVEDAEEFLEKVRRLPESQSAERAVKEIESEESLFEFVVPPELSKNPACKHLALALGDNISFLANEKFPGWPSNDTLIRTKPLILKDGKYYCPNMSLLTYNRMAILEDWIQQSDKRYYGNGYARVRGKVAEDLALRYFSKLVPDAHVYPGVYYNGVDAEGHKVRFEADGLVIFDDTLFLLEIKSAPFSLEAMRGAPKGLNKDLSHLISEPYQQAQRTLEYIKSSSSATFEQRSGEHVVTLSGLDQFRRIYLVNITLSDVGHVSAHLSAARAMGYLDGRAWPWSVSITDLRVISEILESPSEFLLYLERRLSINELPAISTIDELDYLGMFLSEGLYFKEKDIKDLSGLSPVGYTVDIERYYDFLGGRVSSGPKPRLRISDWFRALIRAIEATRKPGAFHVSQTVLGIDGKHHQQIEEWFKNCPQDGQPHTLTMMGREITPLLFVSLTDQGVLAERELNYAEMKRLQSKSKEFIVVSMRRDDFSSVDFRIFEGPFHDVSRLERQVASFSAAKMETYLATQEKPGRNDKCPCGSGRKFKRCCINSCP